MQLIFKAACSSYLTLRPYIVSLPHLEALCSESAVVSKSHASMRPRTRTYMSSYTHVLVHTCPRTTSYMPSYYYMHVLILLLTCPHTTSYMSSYCYMHVLILLHARPRTTTCTSSYYIHVLILESNPARSSLYFFSWPTFFPWPPPPPATPSLMTRQLC